MAEHFIQIRQWLYPFSWLYGIAVRTRNKLFDWGWLQSKSFDAPIICIGNLAVGGTGKTPHTEYLIKLLKDTGLNVAVLSRGYKRQSKGFILADGTSTAAQIGDEPCQMKNKFPDIHVAVDEHRAHGIERLLSLKSPAIDVILLDDAFQHRQVEAGMNILLTDYHRLLCDDTLLPAGNLREPRSGKNRAQIVIVTKCPPDIKPIDFHTATSHAETLQGNEQVLLVTGIAAPGPLLQEVQRRAASVRQLAFGDHHAFSKKDLQAIERQFMQLKGERKLIVTTEKDGARLKSHPDLPQSLQPHIYMLPIRIQILQEQEQIFNQNIINYVRTHSRNSQLSERKDAHTA